MVVEYAVASAETVAALAETVEVTVDWEVLVTGDAVEVTVTVAWLLVAS